MFAGEDHRAGRGRVTPAPARFQDQRIRPLGQYLRLARTAIALRAAPRVFPSFGHRTTIPALLGAIAAAVSSNAGKAARRAPDTDDPSPSATARPSHHESALVLVAEGSRAKARPRLRPAVPGPCLGLYLLLTNWGTGEEHCPIWPAGMRAHRDLAQEAVMPGARGPGLGGGRGRSDGDRSGSLRGAGGAADRAPHLCRDPRVDQTSRATAGDVRRPAGGDRHRRSTAHRARGAPGLRSRAGRRLSLPRPGPGPPRPRHSRECGDHRNERLWYIHPKYLLCSVSLLVSGRWLASGDREEDFPGLKG